MQLYWTFLIGGALCSSLDLESQVFNVYLLQWTPSLPLRSSQIPSAVLTHHWMWPELLFRVPVNIHPQTSCLSSIVHLKCSVIIQREASQTWPTEPRCLCKDPDHHLPMQKRQWNPPDELLHSDHEDDLEVSFHPCHTLVPPVNPAGPPSIPTGMYMPYIEGPRMDWTVNDDLYHCFLKWHLKMWKYIRVQACSPTRASKM